MGTFHSTKNHRQRKGGKCYGYILQSFLKIRKLLNSEKRTISRKIPGGKLKWNKTFPMAFFFRKFGRNLAGLSFLPEIPENYVPFSTGIFRNGESFRLNGKRPAYFLACTLFQGKVHYPAKDTKHSWQGWKSQTSIFTISFNRSKILEVPKNFASSRTPVTQKYNRKWF